MDTYFTDEKAKKRNKKKKVIDHTPLMPYVIIHTDGSFRPPNYGAWAATIQGLQNSYTSMTGYEFDGKIGRMELLAVVSALESLTEPHVVDINIDSQYVVDTIKCKWYLAWERRGWLKADGTPVKNVDLVKRLRDVLNIHNVRAHHVSAHKDNVMNNICDGLARDLTLKMRNGSIVP